MIHCSLGTRSQIPVSRFDGVSRICGMETPFRSAGVSQRQDTATIWNEVGKEEELA